MGGVTIHVFDEARDVKQDFKCELPTLLNSMRYIASIDQRAFRTLFTKMSYLRYFRSYLKTVEPMNDVELSVHCDVRIFGWLLQYAKSASDTLATLTNDMVLPVLISSNFLQARHSLNLKL